MPLPRFRIRTLMIAVAVVASGFALLLAERRLLDGANSSEHASLSAADIERLGFWYAIVAVTLALLHSFRPPDPPPP